MRLTLDIDDAKVEDAVRLFNRLKADFPKNYVEIFISPNGEGYHLIVHKLNVTREQVYKLRQKYGDDPKRLALDKARSSKGIVSSILFTNKKGMTEYAI